MRTCLQENLWNILQYIYILYGLMFLAAIGTVRTHVQTPFDGFSSGSSMLAAVLIIAWRQLINSNGRIRILSTDYHMSKKSGHFVPPFFSQGYTTETLTLNITNAEENSFSGFAFYNSWEITR